MGAHRRAVERAVGALRGAYASNGSPSRDNRVSSNIIVATVHTWVRLGYVLGVSCHVFARGLYAGQCERYESCV